MEIGSRPACKPIVICECNNTEWFLDFMPGSLGSVAMELKPCCQELELKIKQLQDMEGKYRTLFENMLYEVHCWEVVRDVSGKILTWKLIDANPAALKSWGKSLQDVVGKTT